MTLATDRPPIGVLLMTYGGPATLDDLPGYLADIRSGRTTTKAVLDEIRHNYAQIGGKSPLFAITCQQGAALQKALDAEPEVQETDSALQHYRVYDQQPEVQRANSDSHRYRVYLGMRHWSPWIEDTVRDMIADGITQAVALVLEPHYSHLGIAKYHQKVQAGLEMYGGTIDFQYIQSYHTAPGLIAGLVKRVREGIARFPQAEQDEVHVILSAHSLPIRILRMGDPYQEQLFETAGLVATGANLRNDQWSWSYQSAGRSPEPWLGPDIEQHIQELAEKGVRKMVCVPVGFVSDHVEILYDLDIKAQAVARKYGVRLERPPALNDDPLFIGALAELVRERATRWLPQVQSKFIGGFAE